MRRSRLSCVLVLLVAVTLSLSMTSCGGGGGSGSSDLVLLGFNLPNLAGIPLNNPLIFTFSANVNPLSITPDTLRVVGAVGPFFETTVVDGNLVARLPTVPNFDDYTDAGLAPGTTYTVSMPVFPAPSTIESLDGKPLLLADSFTFVTQPSPVFIEHRRPIRHGVPPSSGGRSDDEGCLQNSDNSLFVPPGQVQIGSGVGATLLCLMNEGAPRIIEAESSPRHDERAVGTPSAVSPGRVELPPIRLRFNEALDPLTVSPYVSSTQLPVNMQLLRVAQKDGTPVVPPDEIQTNQPLLVQDLNSVEIILVASDAVQQGIYAVNMTPNIRDLAQNQLRIDDDPNAAATGYGAWDPNIALPGWRLFFRTLELPNTALAINETFANNNREAGNNGSLASEAGVYTWTAAPDPGGVALDDPLLTTIAGVANPITPNYTLLDTLTNCGQSTTANWNNGLGTGYRMMNLAGLSVNSDVTSGADELKAVFMPWCGSGEDIAIDTRVLGDTSLDTTNTGSLDNDGIYETPQIYIDVGDSVSASGDKPLLIFCRGDCTILGTLNVDGDDGGPGFDTDGSTNYTNPGALPAGGAPGAAGTGGGAGGAGANPVTGGSFGNPGLLPSTVHTTNPSLFLGAVVPVPGNFDDVDVTGGGGGGFGNSGGNGANAANSLFAPGGTSFGTTTFTKPLVEFLPDRAYLPFANVSGGMGGSGGGALDANNDTVGQNGDHGGGGGGGAGGGIWIIVCGNVTIGPNAVISANGGDGGNTYAIADQLIALGDDGNVGGGDDFLAGVKPAATPSGAGGPGGGGAGGAICIIGRGTFDVQGNASITANAGSAGQAAPGGPTAGSGAGGRIVLATFGSSAANPVISGTATVSAATVVTTTRWNPPHEQGVGTTHVSVGQSDWIDLFTPTADFDPDTIPPPGDVGTNLPAIVDNAGFLQGAPFNLVKGTDFDYVVEYQGAADLSPLPGGLTPPALAEGLTNWDTDINVLDGKRYIRFRFRFFVDEAYPAFGIAGAPLPAVFDITIPYVN